MSNMSDKLQESLQYLKQYSIIENEAYKLYETLSKKINRSESSFIVGIGCDSLKNTKIIQGILDCFDPELENKIARKDLAKLVEEIMALEKKSPKLTA